MADRTTHTALPMGGRDPSETHRAATPLELLFDLTFVIAYGAAADQLAEQIAHHHTKEGLIGFGFAIFAVTWAWIFWTWFSSAYDTDDWIYRLLTMVQMVGVLILALGLPAMFASLVDGDHVDNTVMVIGYVVMRVPMLLQWWRASLQDPGRRRLCQTMMLTILLSQVVWCLLVFANLSIGTFFLVLVPLVLLELAGPILAETRHGGTPWHPHHIAERYGLLVIITLGEGLLGTVIALRAVIADGWSLDAGVLGFAGTAMIFGLWWGYFVIPHGPLLRAHRERSFGWGYEQMVLFGALVAVGAGLHVAAYHLGDEYHVSSMTTVWSVAIPLAVFVVAIYTLYAQLTRTLDPFHLLLAAGSFAVLAAGVAMAAAGVDMVWCVLVLALTPWVSVVGYEAVGHRHNERVLAGLSDD
jgi:low temperature requirement protein LtrA